MLQVPALIAFFHAILQAAAENLEATTPNDGSKAMAQIRPWYRVYESNLKNMIFFALSFIVVAGFLGDKYYEYVRMRHKRDRETKKADKDSKPRVWDPDRQAVLTEAVRQVVQRKPEPSA
eukprot:s271_g9.t1